MKFRKNWKRFWTLDRHHAEGFTLVELIVVIAILAILAGVGTVGYSGYVKKANIAADQSLISEVENAVLLYNYSTQFASDAGTGTVGYLILTEDGAEAKDMLASSSYISEAMDAAFGTGWEDKLSLSYSGWTDTATMLNQVANNQYAASVNGSTYITDVGTETLLGDVQGCASNFAEFLVTIINGKQWSGEETAELLDSMLGTSGSDDESGIVESLVGQYGGEVSSDVLANATVFGLAASIDDSSAAAVIAGFKDKSTAGYIAGAKNLSLDSDNLLAVIAHTYAALEAFVGYMNEPTVTAELTKLNESGLVGSTNAILGNIQTACNEARKAALKNARAKYDSYYGDAVSGTKTQAELDGEAYVGIMQTVNNLSGDYTSGLGQSGLFATEDMANRVNSYVAAASLKDAIENDDLLAEIAAGEYGSAVVLVFTSDNGSISCVKCPANA